MRRGTAEKATMGGSADTPMKAGSEGKATQTVSDKDKKANRISRFLGSKAGKSTESLATKKSMRDISKDEVEDAQLSPRTRSRDTAFPPPIFHPSLEDSEEGTENMNRTVSYEDAAHHRVHDEASNIVNTEENHKDGAATVLEPTTTVTPKRKQKTKSLIMGKKKQISMASPDVFNSAERARAQEPGELSPRQGSGDFTAATQQSTGAASIGSNDPSLSASLTKKDRGMFGRFKKEREKDKKAAERESLTVGAPTVVGVIGGGLSNMYNASDSSVSITRVSEGHIVTLEKQKELYCKLVLGYILQLLGLADEESNAIRDQVDAAIRGGEDVFSIGRSLLLPTGEVNLLRQIIRDTDSLIKTQERQQAVLSLQRWWRMVRERKIFRSMSESARHRMVLFNRSFHELLELEELYVDSLHILVTRYIQPLRAKAMSSGKEIVKLEDIATMFSNSEDLLTIHRALLQKLKQMDKRWVVKGLGQALAEWQKKLKAYSVYASNVQTAKETVMRLRDTKSSFNKFILDVEKRDAEKEKGEKKAMGSKDVRTLNDFLMEPISHSDAVYSYLSVLCANAGSEEEKEKLQVAENAMQAITKEIRKNILQMDESVALMNVQRRLTGYEGPLNLVATGRALKKEGQLQNKKYLFIFNDLIILTKPAGHKGLYKLKEMINPIEAECGAVSEKEFFIKWPKDVQMFTCKHKRELDEWLQAIVPMTNVNSVFGIPVEDLAERDKQLVPKAVVRMMTHLEDHKALELEGIFRISGQQVEVAELRNMFDTYPPDEINLKLYKPHAVSGAMKLWLRSLPEPMMSFHVYDLLVGEYQDAPHNLSTLVALLKTMKASNRATLMFIIKYLNKVVQLKEMNKMTPANLAIVFGPSLLRSRADVEDASALPLCNQTVQTLITKYEQIMKMLDEEG